MEIKLKRYRNIHILLLTGELDLYNAPKLEKGFDTLRKRGIKTLIIDFSEISYIDSSGVGILLKLKRMSEPQTMNFILSGVTGEVLNVLSLTNLLQFFRIEKTHQIALKKLLQKKENVKSEQL